MAEGLKQASTGEVFNNLVAHTYIYSHTSHFEYDLNNRIAFGRRHGGDRIFTAKKLIPIRDSLIKSIKIITEKCNAFYEDMGIQGRDSVTFSSKGIDVQLSGAREFERKYLMGGTSNSKNLGDRVGEINDIMVSVGYQQEVLSRLRASSENGTQNSIKEKAINFFQETASQNLEGVAVQKLTESIQNNTFDAISAVDILFATKTNRKAGTDTLTQVQQKLLQDFLQTMNKPEGVFKRVQHNKEELKKFRNSIKREIANTVFSVDKVAQVMYEVLIEKLAERGIHMDAKQKAAIKEVLSTQLKPALLSVLRHEDSNNMVDFEVMDARLNGLILEQSVALSINMDNLFTGKRINYKKISQSIAQVTGQERNEKGQQIKADLRVTGKSGTVYDIQAKNSFSTKDYDAIHIQSNIKVDTFANEVFADEWEKKVFEFFILNRAFLSRAGLENSPSSKSGWQAATLGTKDNATLILMIQFFLNQSIFHLIGSRVQELIRGDADLQKVKDGNVSLGNLFFIFRKNYFMPVSVFLFSAVNCLNQLIERSTRDSSPDFLNSIGKLTYSRELQGFSTSYNYTFNKGLIAKKMSALSENDLQSGVTRYPDNLVEIGSAVGQDMLKEAEFKGVNFSLSIQKLDELLK